MPSLIALLLACGSPAPSPVRATLTGEQVFVGEVRTRELLLETALGSLAIPLEDVGEVVPVEGAHLAASHQYVTVWLRNGSELRGRWADPKLTLDVTVAEQPVSVELPMADLVRIQTPGDLAWPDATIFRVETTHGDDLLVDAGKTTVTLANPLGTFSPTLAECASLEPLGDPTGDWRVTLQTGTVLVGALQHESLTLALPLGPPEVEVPVAQLKRLSWQQWGARSQYDSLDQAPRKGDWFSSGSAAAAKRLH